MTEVYTIFGGDMWRQTLNGVVTILGASTFDTLLRIVGLFGVLGVMVSFIKSRNPMVFLHWLAVFMLITSVLLVPKRSVQIIDITDRAGVYEVDNVPLGLAVIAGLSTGAGFGVAQLYDYALSRPDSLTYTKSGMLFGSQIVAQSSDFRTQNPQLAQILTDYVENCVIGDILLNSKYTIAELLNSTDPLTLITNNPSPLRGLYQTTSTGREFVTCVQAATTIKTLMGQDIRIGGTSWHDLATRVFGNKVNADTLLGNAMNESYGFFYKGGQSAAQIMRNNVTNAAVRDGWKGFAARSSDTANLVNLATESSLTKQRLSWAAGGAIAARTLPMFQSLMMLILIGLFPLVVALSLVNHSIYGLNTLKLYAGGFLYFQMWPIMFAILNSLANFYLQTKTGSTDLVLANADRVALQHSDVANIAGYLSMSIPILSFYLTKGAASVASQAVGGVMSSAAFATGGQASTTADGNWSFNNMSMDNVSANKFDTNLMQRQGQQSHQLEGGSMRTQTSDGHNVYDTSGAISTLPVSMKLSSLASSGFSEQARQAQQEAQTSLDGYNHSVTSGFQQLSQLSRQSGSSDSLTQGSDSSLATNASRGASMMMSSAESYGKAHNISTQEAYNRLMDISNQGSTGVGGSAHVKWDSGDQVAGKVGKWATGLSVGGEGHVNADWKHTSGSSHGTQDSSSQSRDFRHDENSQAVKDFRQGMDMVGSTRVSDSGNHTDNQSDSRVEQFAATLNDAKSQYHQFTDSSTRSQEFSRMATLSQNQSASLDANYNQEFVDWTTAKYGQDAEGILTNVNSARTAATEFVEERLKPEIMSNYGSVQAVTATAPLSPSASLPSERRENSESSPVAETSPGMAYAAGGSGEGYPQSERPAGQGGERQAQTGRVTHSSGAQAEEPVSRTQHAGHNGRRDEARADVHENRSAGSSLSGGGLKPDNSVVGREMVSDFGAAKARIAQQAEGTGIKTGIGEKVAAQRSENADNIRENGVKAGEKGTTVQASSDILKGEYSGAVKGHNIGRTEEDLKQTRPWLDSEKDESLKTKLKALREQQDKAS
ncbi:conjugal transfer mating-pair stabilization protein TraG [Erwinia aphidicola]|uniref:conjugal transfer mating-pair stabilization protein TraG n=1 Tax=Erwinia aphidicola TaxID=68334 RepID=UPI003CEEC58F